MGFPSNRGPDAVSTEPIVRTKVAESRSLTIVFFISVSLKVAKGLRGIANSFKPSACIFNKLLHFC